MKYIVYQTTNLKNNKIYLGVHKCENPEIFDGYLGCGIKITVPSSYMNPTTPLQFAVKKYGTKLFKRTTLKTFDSLEDAFKLEAELVTQEFINRKDTYNAKLGGQGGCSYFVEIYQFDLKGQLVKKWNSIKEASNFYSISDTAIFNAAKFKGSCKNYFWSKVDTIQVSEYSHYVGQICYKYSGAGKLVDSYNSLVEAAKDNNTYLQSIQRAVKGGYKVNDYFYSLELQEEYSQIPKISLKGKTLFVYSLEGIFITALSTTPEILEFFKIKSPSSITTAIRTKRQYKNYQLSLEYYDMLPPVTDKRNLKKKVGKFTLTGDFIEEFGSVTEAAKKCGSGVLKVVRGQQQQCKGFIFKYL